MTEYKYKTKDELLRFLLFESSDGHIYVGIREDATIDDCLDKNLLKTIKRIIK